VGGLRAAAAEDSDTSASLDHIGVKLVTAKRRGPNWIVKATFERLKRVAAFSRTLAFEGNPAFH
jgi:hypothetical protein